MFDTDDLWLDGGLDGLDVESVELPGEESGGVPAGLEGWEPGPELAAILSTLEVDRLSGADRVVVLRAYERMASFYAAARARTMAAIVDAYREQLVAEGFDDEEFAWEAAAAEVSAALHLTRRASESELDQAAQLVERLPRVGEALASGRIDRRRALVLCQQTRHLPEETARRVVDEALEEAEELTTGQLGALIRRLVIALDPELAAQRLKEAVRERRVVSEPTSDGTAHLMVLDAGPEQVQAARERINRIAQGLKAGDDPRSIDQLRADVALDLLCNGETHLTRDAGVGPGGRVELVVDLTTLAGLDDNPAQLSGFGPIVADIARRVAPQISRWEYTVTHPHTGDVVATGVTRRRPTTAQTRQVRARNRTCTFPGCRMPAKDCDLDHRRPYTQGGPTCPCNLTPLCRFHHTLRHRLGWTHQVGPDGDHTWTSPLGHTYTKRGRSP